MPKELAVNPGKCIGWCTCALTCAITHHWEFNLTKPYICITRHEFDGTFAIGLAPLIMEIMPQKIPRSLIYS
jgi:hypothetical protein